MSWRSLENDGILGGRHVRDLLCVLSECHRSRPDFAGVSGGWSGRAS